MNHMKQTLKFLSSVLLISLLGLVNCHKYETGGSSSNGFIVGQYINGLIQSATTGNCAISVNLGSLYAGAIVQGAAASSTNFTAANYEAATAKTIAAQGYTAATNASVAAALVTATNTIGATAASISAARDAANSVLVTPTAANVAALIAAATTAYGATSIITTSVTAAANSVYASATAANAAAVANAEASTALAGATAAGTAITTCVTAGTAQAICQGAAVTAAQTVKNLFTAANTTGASAAAITAAVPATARTSAIAAGEAAVGGPSTNVTAAATSVATATVTAATAYYGLVAANQVYASVPYNKKYDAFLTDAGAWTSTTRATAVAAQKASTDLAALTGSLFVPYMTLLGNGVSNATALAAAKASIEGFYATYSDAEKTTMAKALGSANTITTLNTLVTTATTAQMFNTGTAGSAVSGTGTFGSILCAAGGGTSGAVILLNSFTCASGINAAFGTIPPGSFGTATTGGLGAVGQAYLARLSYAKGSALMACARIPKSNCTVDALLTGSREADVTSLVGSYNTIAATQECRKPTNALLHRVLTNGLTGYPKETAVAIGNNSFLNTSTVGGSEGSTTGLTGNPILAAKAYPKSGALLTIASTFTSAHPMKSGSTAYPVDGATPFYGGSNLNVANVASCEAIGLGGVGTTPIQATDSHDTINAKRKLTDVKEIVYAFSAGNTAATAYAGAIGFVSGGTVNDAYACNSQMRKNTTIPAVLGLGTTLPVINTLAGDGGATSLVTACVYGGDSGSRTSVSALLAGTLPGLTSCPAAAAAGATGFGATGLTTYPSFPNGQ